MGGIRAPLTLREDQQTQSRQVPVHLPYRNLRTGWEKKEELKTTDLKQLGKGRCEPLVMKEQVVRSCLRLHYLRLWWSGSLRTAIQIP